jgi:RNA polymerase sigma factor (TIGR02999 family)
MSETANPDASGSESMLTSGFYAALRDLAGPIFAAERAGHTLQPTAVVNEACLRIMSSGLPDLPREQQLAIAGRVLRQVLIDHARARGAMKRGGGRGSLSLDAGGRAGAGEPGTVMLEIEDDVLASGETLIEFDQIHRAIDRLAQVSPRQAEVVMLRVFSGLTMEQVAAVAGVSKRSAENDWAVGRAWLRRELDVRDGARQQ